MQLIIEIGMAQAYDNQSLMIIFFIWNHKQFKRTFMTASSGLPECLFNSGYSWLEAFSTTFSRFYDKKTGRALASKEKVDELAALNDGGAIVTIRENEIPMDISLMLTNLVSFFKDMRLKYNNGRGTQDIVTFLWADFVDDMQIKWQIKLSNDSVILVDPEIFNFIVNPNIASILQTSKD
jgi:hypothetical protein